MQTVSLESLEQQLVSHFFNQNYALIESELPTILESYPDWLNGWKILSDTLFIQGKDASEAAQQALALNQEDAQEHNYYGLVLKRNGDLTGAKTAFETAIRLKPDHVAAMNNLAIVEKDLGQVAKGIALFRQALKNMPDYAECHSNLLFCLSHTEPDPEQLFIAHQAYGAQFETPYIKQWPVHRNLGGADRPLKIGFVSADFRDHSMAYCFEPLLNALSTQHDLALYAYYNQSIIDDTTKRMQQQFTHWQQVSDLSDAALLRQIRQDGIDILVDLSGHSAYNRLPVFAKKPAPIQVSWFGYLATTGLKAMDYYCSDPYLAPPQQFDAYFTEKLVQLPVNALYKPPVDAPAVNALPALSQGHLSFASFHRSSKISQLTISRWAAILNAIPTSTLLLAGLEDASSETYFIEAFAKHEIAPARLSFAKRTSMHAYLAMHATIDLCLDTYPSSGITPALHAAWMGVPTLCEATETLTGRGAMAIMSHLHQSQVIGEDWDAVLAHAVYFATHLDELAQIRANLRAQFSDSALMDAPAQAQALSMAFRQMWQRWLKRKHTDSFQVALHH